MSMIYLSGSILCHSVEHHMCMHITHVSGALYVAYVNYFDQLQAVKDASQYCLQIFVVIMGKKISGLRLIPRNM